MGKPGKQIAKAGLEIGAISLNPEKPFQWASGYRMPIYNDNRMLLGQYKHREMVASALARIIKSEGVKYDHVAGTSTSGIAPAASVANLLKVPLVILDGSEEKTPFVFENPPVLEILLYEEFIDACAIASTCPWAIPYGVTTANGLEMPFMYVRQSQKKHGLKQQVEGNPQFGESVALLDLHRGDSYKENAIKALHSLTTKDGESLEIEVIETISCDISDKVQPLDVTGKDIVVIEDLISTGGSSVGEVKAYRGKGANVSHCFSIFDYELGVAHGKFNEEDCEVRSALTYDVMLDTALQMGEITEEHEELLREWRQDPFGWGEKHGFPKVEKK